MDSAAGLRVLCYLIGRIASLVEPIVSTIFKNLDYRRFWGKRPYQKIWGRHP